MDADRHGFWNVRQDDLRDDVLALTKFARSDAVSETNVFPKLLFCCRVHLPFFHPPFAGSVVAWMSTRGDKGMKGEEFPVGLPWLSEDRISRSLPFRERHRAITTGVASPEALSICIRHCVMRRGFDYGGAEEGRFPWGESAHYSAANTWLSTACITDEMAEHLKTLGPELIAKKNPSNQENKFNELILQRLAWSKEHDIARVLAEHSKSGHDNLRFPARGFNFPRQNVWQHLESIIRHPRHAGFISDVDKFIAALGINPNRQPDEKTANRARKRAIFFYNRKTRFDMERHWAKKVNVCPFARWLELDDVETRCDLKESLAVRRWNILEFSATRRVELDIVEGRGKTRTKRNVLHGLNANTVKALVAFVEKHHNAIEKKDKAGEPKRDDANDLIIADIASVHGERIKPSPQAQSEWNKSFYTQLWDLLMPTAANRKKRASTKLLRGERDQNRVLRARETRESIPNCSGGSEIKTRWSTAPVPGGRQNDLHFRCDDLAILPLTRRRDAGAPRGIVACSHCALWQS
jgi:hypothetical protein